MKYIVTGTNQEYFEKWGNPWIFTLQEIAGFDGKILLFGQAETSHVQVESCELVSKINLWLKIAEYAESHPGFFYYWDMDVIFQEKIPDLEGDSLFYCENNDPGFVAGSAIAWRRFSQFIHLCLQTQVGLSDSKILNFYTSHFAKFCTALPDNWNFVDIPKLKDSAGRLSSESKIPWAIHFVGEIKRHLAGRSILVSERYPNEYKKWLASPQIIGKLINKRALNGPISDVGKQLQ